MAPPTGIEPPPARWDRRGDRHGADEAHRQKLSIWSDPAGGLLVVPRVPMRTVLIERGIVTFDPGVGVRVEPPKGAVTGAIPKQRPVTASEPEFYAQLEQTRPDYPGLAGELQAFLVSLSELGVEPVFRRSVVLRFRPSPDYDASAGYVDKTGAFHHVDAWIGADRLGRTAAGDAYLRALADAVGGTVREKDGSAWPTWRLRSAVICSWNPCVSETILCMLPLIALLYSIIFRGLHSASDIRHKPEGEDPWHAVAHLR